MKLSTVTARLLGALLLQACASLQPITATPTVMTNYTIGETRSAGIGDAIFDVQSAVRIPEFVALRAHDPGKAGLFRSFPPIVAGARYRAYAKLDDGNLVLRSRADSLSQDYVVITPEGRALGYWDGKQGATGGTWPQEPLFASEESLEGQAGAYRAQMIYSGLDGNTVRAAYREFSGDFIRPAFTQELQYNLAQDSTIAYKTIKIRVLEASNSQILPVLENGKLRVEVKRFAGPRGEAYDMAKDWRDSLKRTDPSSSD